MEEIKKALETLKSELEEAQELYLSKLETAIAGIKSSLDSIPKPSPVSFNTEKILNLLSTLSKPSSLPETKAEKSSFSSLKNSLIQIDKGKTQVEILDSFLKESSQYASRVAIFIFKSEQAVGWKGMGFTKFGADDSKIKTIIFPLSQGNPFFNTYQNKSTYLYQPLSEDLIIKTLGGPKPEKVFLTPLIIKDKVAAALYADEIKGAINLEPDILEILTYISSLCISLIGLRQLLPSPTLSRPESLKIETSRPSKPEVAPPPPPAPPAPPVQPPPSPERTQKFDIKTMQQLEAIKRETLKKPPEVVKEPTPAVQIPPAIPKPAPPPVIKKEEFEETKVTETYEVEMEEVKEVEAEEYEEIKPEYEVPEAPPASEWAAEQEGGMREFEPEEIKKPVAPPPPPPPPPSPEEIEEIYAKKSVEVKPPADFKKERPGFGFESIPVQPGLTPEESKRHDEARRFARLLVSEIKLYNENKVEEGRRNKNIYSLLKEDIDRSKQLYEERIAADIRAKSDYFRQALVSILAGGDSSALGPMDF